MNSIDSIASREKILELIDRIKDDEVPEFMKKIYSAKCELQLIKYCGKDVNDLWNKYLVVSR